MDILVGTQMLAKGHDFPRLTLVGVVNADSALYSTDFRAAEKLFAQLTQVAGRAGRGDAAGEVLIQTRFPGHPLYEAVQRQDYAAFAQMALAERREAGFPPYAHQVLLRAEALQREAGGRFLGQAAQAGSAARLPRWRSTSRCRHPSRGSPAASVGICWCRAASRDELQRFLMPGSRICSGPEARPRALGAGCRSAGFVARVSACARAPVRVDSRCADGLPSGSFAALSV